MAKKSSNILLMINKTINYDSNEMKITPKYSINCTSHRDTRSRLPN